MREEDVRKRTKVLVDALFDLTGYMPEVSVGDFLLLRERAVRELKGERPASAGGPAELPMVASAPPEAKGRRSEPHVSRPPAPAMVHPAVHEEPVHEAMDEGTASGTEETEGGKTAMSDFELLRSLEDPWN